MKKYLFFWVSIALLLGGKSTEAKKGEAPPPNADALVNAIIDNNPTGPKQLALGIRVLQELHKQLPRRNLLLSPWELYANLALLHEGSAEKTREVLAKALGISPGETDAWRKQMAGMVQGLQQLPEVQHRRALWLPKATALQAGFTDSAKRFQVQLPLLSGIPVVDSKTVTTWFSKGLSTLDKAQRPPSPSTKRVDVLELTSTLNLDGIRWQQPFDKKERGLFQVDASTNKNVEFVRDSQFLYYLQGGLSGACAKPNRATSAAGEKCIPSFAGDKVTYQAVWIPLHSSGQRLNALVILPESIENAFTENLLTYLLVHPEGERTTHTKEAVRMIDLKLPSFATSFADNSALQKVWDEFGLQPVFQAPNFSKMATFANGIPFLRWNQRAALKMDQLGVTARAWTAAESNVDPSRFKPIGASSTGDTFTPIPMIVNRPFLVAIVDDVTRAVLFLGLINDPTAKQ